MEPVKFVILAVRIFLILGLAFGYKTIVIEMANAAADAHQHHSFSAAKFNRMLWKPSPAPGGHK